MSALSLINELCLAGEQSFFKIDDPGNAKPLPANKTGTVELVSTGAETRTLAVPAGIGLRLSLVMKTDGGDIVVTVASAFNAAADTTLTFNTAGDFVVLESVQVGSAMAWRLVASEGVAVTVSARNFTADGLTIGGVIVSPLIPVAISLPLNGDMVDQTAFIAHRALQLVGATFSHGTASGGAGKLQLTKDTSTTAPGAGTGLLTNNTNTGFDVNATANTPQTGTLTATTANLQLAAGDRIGFDFSGTLTSLVKANVTLWFQPI